jgi:hypothetical protein
MVFEKSQFHLPRLDQDLTQIDSGGNVVMAICTLSVEEVDNRLYMLSWSRRLSC